VCVILRLDIDWAIPKYSVPASEGVELGFKYFLREAGQENWALEGCRCGVGRLRTDYVLGLDTQLAMPILGALMEDGGSFRSASGCDLQ
jgi:hypothetical protein